MTHSRNKQSSDVGMLVGVSTKGVVIDEFVMKGFVGAVPKRLGT